MTTHGALGNPTIGAQANAEFIEDRTGILTNPGAGSCWSVTLAGTQSYYAAAASILTGFEKLRHGSLSSSTRQALDNTYGADWPDVELLFLKAYSGNQEDLVFSTPLKL